MHLNIGLISLFLCLKINEVTSSSFFLLERGDDNWQHLGATKSHFTCDRDKDCTHVKYDKGTKQFTLIKEGNPVSDTANDDEIVWRKVRQTFGSCEEALPSQVKERDYWIQQRNMLNPLRVRCKRESGKGYAIFSHNSEANITVQGYEAAGLYKHAIQYNDPLQDIKSFVDSSLACKQFLRIDCFHMRISNFASLLDRNMAKLLDFGSGVSNATGCSCGVTNTCAGTGMNCNCDVNDSVWRFDQGYITDKTRLPLLEIRLGDTGETYEKGHFIIGKLMCE